MRALLPRVRSYLIVVLICISLIFFWAPKSLHMVTAAMKLKDAYSLEGKLMTTLESIVKSRDITLPTKVHLVKAMFCCGHVWM